MSMLSVDAAIDRLLLQSRRLTGPERAGLFDSFGRVLAQDIVAPIDVPPADNSAMDGYAIRHADWSAADASISLSQRITAGSVPSPLAPGTAARIFTGAEIPPGADTVVMQEHCEASAAAVAIRQLPSRGANIRPRGQDIRAGQTILTAGHRLRPQDTGLIASQGISGIEVYSRLKVAVMSTGDELVAPGDEISPGQIYNSNRFTICGLLSAWGFQVVDLGVARDDPGAIASMMTEAAESADVVITSGGVSVGDEDHVKPVVESLGAIDLWRIAIKPGKPFAFGHVLNTPFIGLPGNPVSVFATLLIVGRPYLFACQGMSRVKLHPTRERALFEKKGSPREVYHRVRSGPEGLEMFSQQSSGALYSTTWGDGLVRQAAGQDIRPGDSVDFLPYALMM
jgi:molybdopterin molybdotransferase